MYNKKMHLSAMLVMALISFVNIFGVSIAGISIFIGVAFFFINKAIEKQPFASSGLDIKAIGRNLEEKKRYGFGWLFLLLWISFLLCFQSYYYPNT